MRTFGFLTMRCHACNTRYYQGATLLVVSKPGKKKREKANA
jgi:hypothetical protein